MIIVQLGQDELKALISEAVQQGVKEITTQQKTEPVQWFNLVELCEYHPDKSTFHTVYKWVHTGNIPHHKTGKKLRFLKSEIDQWLLSGKQKTTTEIGNEAKTYIKKKGGEYVSKQ